MITQQFFTKHAISLIFIITLFAGCTISRDKLNYINIKYSNYIDRWNYDSLGCHCHCPNLICPTFRNYDTLQLIANELKLFGKNKRQIVKVFGKPNNIDTFGNYIYFGCSYCVNYKEVEPTIIIDFYFNRHKLKNIVTYELE